MENILFKGETNEKLIEGEKRVVTPITYSGQTPFGTEIGVGLNFEDDNKSLSWGLIKPARILASYRGMKIAELVPEFNKRTLADCWYAGNRDENISTFDKESILRIEELIGEDARKRILEQIPESKSLDVILKYMKETLSYFEISEILREVRNKTIEVTPTIQPYVTKAYLDLYNKIEETQMAYDSLRNESLFESVKRHLTGRKE